MEGDELSRAFEKRPLPSLTSAFWVCARPTTGTSVIDKTKDHSDPNYLAIRTLEADVRRVFMVASRSDCVYRVEWLPFS